MQQQQRRPSEPRSGWLSRVVLSGTSEIDPFYDKIVHRCPSFAVSIVIPTIAKELCNFMIL